MVQESGLVVKPAEMTHQTRQNEPSGKKLPGPVIVITGPTASGKSGVAMALADGIGGEIVCGDSMQVYQDMDIGTAKPTPADMQKIPHHLFSIKSPEENYNIALYTEDAKNVLHDILKRGKTPILCGGTGQYIDALLKGLEFSKVPFDSKLREELERRAHTEGEELLHRELSALDPESADRIQTGDRKRIIRALEINLLTGKTRAQMEAKTLEKGPDFNFLSFCINQERQHLYKTINKRVDSMLKEGLLDEVKRLRNKYPDLSVTAAQAIGYKEISLYLDSQLSLDQAIETLKQATRNYAKRQLTRFRKMPSLHWISDMETEQATRFILDALREKN